MARSNKTYFNAFYRNWFSKFLKLETPICTCSRPKNLLRFASTLRLTTMSGSRPASKKRAYAQSPNLTKLFEKKIFNDFLCRKLNKKLKVFCFFRWEEWRRSSWSHWSPSLPWSWSLVSSMPPAPAPATLPPLPEFNKNLYCKWQLFHFHFKHFPMF